MGAHSEGRFVGISRPVVEMPLQPPLLNPFQASPQVLYVRSTQRSRFAYIVLGLFFGVFGIHNFYAGRMVSGVLQLLITLTLGWFIIGLVINFVWVFGEIICRQCDGNGVPFSA